MKQPRVAIGLDPGGTTGGAYLLNPEDKPLSHWVWGAFEFDRCKDDGRLMGLLRELGAISREAEPYRAEAVVHIIYESFDFRHEERNRDKIDYTAAEVIGALRLWAYERPYVRLIRSGASLGKGFWTDDKIKKLGLWVPGKRHAMDATRHLLRHLAFTQDRTELFQPFRPGGPYVETEVECAPGCSGNYPDCPKA